VDILLKYFIKLENHERRNSKTPTASAVYGLGLIGAAVYFISTATGFGLVVLGFLKAIVWPAFLVICGNETVRVIDPPLASARF
jgi:hypothetical protein